MTLSEQEHSVLKAGIDLRLWTQIVEQGNDWIPYIRVGYEYAREQGEREMELSFSGSPTTTTTTIKGSMLKPSSLVLGLGIHGKFKEYLSVGMDYTARCRFLFDSV